MQEKIFRALAPLLLLAVVGLALLGCSGEKFGQGVDKKVPLVKARDVVLNPQLKGTNVRLEGMIVSQCQSNGCWFFLQDDTGQIFINLSPGNFTLPARMGKKVQASGTVAVGQGGYQLIATGVEVL